METSVALYGIWFHWVVFVEVDYVFETQTLMLCKRISSA
jgi:hypothetical protein